MTSTAFLPSSLSVTISRSTFIPSHSSLTPRRLTSSSTSFSTTTPTRATATVPTPSATSTDPSASSSTALPRLVNLFDKVPAKFRSALLRLPEDAEISELGARHTKIIATIGPSTCSPDNLLRLIAGGVAVIRLNLSHGDLSWHRRVIDDVRNINLTTPFVAGVMLDVGSVDSLRLGEFSRNPVLKKGDTFTLTVRHEAEYPEYVSEVSNDAFLDVVMESDLLQCQSEVNEDNIDIDNNGGIVELMVKSKTGTDIICQVVTPGILKSRGSITIRGKSLNMIPKTNENDDMNLSIARAVLGCPPEHIQFAVNEHVEYIALSFVESSDQVNSVKNLLQDRGAQVGIIAKIESANALRNLESIVEAADGIMIARGDLGSTIHYEKVPYWQSHIAQICRIYGKPCLVSTHFLESMVIYPTPTRAEVTDMTEAAKQRVDALVLTAETASGKFPFKSISVMNSVLLKMQMRLHEQENKQYYFSNTTSIRSSSSSNIHGRNIFANDEHMNGSSHLPPMIKDSTWWTPGVGDIAEQTAECAADIANRQSARAILVFTQKGLMATLTSRRRPQAPIYAFTATPVVRNRLNVLYGVRPFRIQFKDDPEETITLAMETLLERQAIKKDDLVVILADVLGGRQGSSKEELKKAFDEIANRSSGNGPAKKWLTASEVRSALRLLSLKVSDRVEAQLAMRDVDVAEAEDEMMVGLFNQDAVGGNSAVDAAAYRQYDFERFQEFASTAKEIVHTLQLRRVE